MFGAGRATAQVMCDDLEIDFERAGTAGMKLYGTDRRELMTVSRIERDGNQLVIKAKVFGTMPMTATLTPADVRAGLEAAGRYRDPVSC